MDGMSILERYKQSMLVPSKDLEFNADDEHLLTLFQDEWLRILLIRKKDQDHMDTIEVELSLPPDDSSTHFEENADIILETALRYLNFMKHLSKNGFSLQLVDRDWVWTASIDVNDKSIKNDFFEILSPLPFHKLDR